MRKLNFEKAGRAYLRTLTYDLTLQSTVSRKSYVDKQCAYNIIRARRGSSSGAQTRTFNSKKNWRSKFREICHLQLMVEKLNATFFQNWGCPSAHASLLSCTAMPEYSLKRCLADVVNGKLHVRDV